MSDVSIVQPYAPSHGGFSVEILSASYASAFRTVVRLTADRHLAEDLAQESVARLVANWSKVSSGHEHWTSRVATNLAIAETRRRGSAARAFRRLDPPLPLPPSSEEFDLDLLDALRRLPRRQREVVVLRYVSDLSQEEVATTLGCSVGAVRQHASRGLAALRKRLGTQHPIIRPIEGVSNAL